MLDLPWIHDSVDRDLTVTRGGSNVLRYDDAIELSVAVIDPAAHESVEDAVDAVSAATKPGVVTLIAGAVPLRWRAQLRLANVSFLDVSGVAEIRWPRINVSTTRFAKDVERHRAPMPLQKGHALAIQQLLAATFAGDQLTVSELADSAGVSRSTASRTVTQLVAQGFARKAKANARTVIEIADPVGVAELLADRSSWPQGRTLSGYVWGRNTLEIASTVSSNATQFGFVAAVTGRTALAYLGVISTSSPPEIRVWVDSNGQELAAIAPLLGLESAPAEEANVVLSIDPWHVGTHKCSKRSFGGHEAVVAHPLRVWCDLHDERRGPEFAAQLWKVITNGS
jgi:MarR family